MIKGIGEELIKKIEKELYIVDDFLYHSFKGTNVPRVEIEMGVDAFDEIQTFNFHNLTIFNPNGFITAKDFEREDIDITMFGKKVDLLFNEKDSKKIRIVLVGCEFNLEEV